MPAACAAVRDQLAELAVGVLSEADRRAVERHLEWCAACRKEAGELTSAAATLAFTLAPATPPEGLSARVLGDVARAVRTPAFRRRTRAAATVAVAATIALGAMSFGAVMAGRAQRAEVLANAEARERLVALQQFQKLFQNFSDRLGTGLRTDETRLVRLVPPATRSGGGAALQLVSRRYLDFVMAHVNGLPDDQAALPYTVWLVDGEGDALRAGRITTLDANGGGEVFHQFDVDLTAFSTVVVRDARGTVALRGRAEVVTP